MRPSHALSFPRCSSEPENPIDGLVRCADHVPESKFETRRRAHANITVIRSA